MTLIRRTVKYFYMKLKFMKYPKFKWNGKNFIFCNLEVDKTSEVDCGNISFGCGCSIRVRKNAKFIVGDNVCFNNNCVLTCRSEIRIGNNVSFGPNCLIFDNDHDYTCKDYFNNYKANPIIIEDNVWIGGGAIILRGSIIHENAVIGAGVVVKGEIPANTVVINKQDLVFKEYVRKM